MLWKVILSGKKDPSTNLWTLPIDAHSGQKTKSIGKKVPTSAQQNRHLEKWNSTVSHKLDPTKLRTAEQYKKNMVVRDAVPAHPQKLDGVPTSLRTAESIKKNMVN